MIKLMIQQNYNKSWDEILFNVAYDGFKLLKPRNTCIRYKNAKY